MGTTFQFAWEVGLISWIQSNIMSIPFIRNIVAFVTDFGDPSFAVIVVCVLYWVYDKRSGIYMALNIAGATVMTSMVKNVFDRRRPYFDNENIESLKSVDDKYDPYDIKAQGFSFPSGHATCGGSATVSAYSYFKNKKMLIALVILYGLVGFSRIALGVHYPTDIIVGFLIGGLMSLLIPFIVNKLGKKKAYILFLVFFSLGIFYCKSNDYFSSLGLIYGVILGDLFENRFVNFSNTRNIIKAVIRSLVGLVIFIAILTGSKIPFSVDFLDGTTLGSHLFRTLRYGLSSFVALGLYPMLFKFNILKLGDKMEK